MIEVYMAIWLIGLILLIIFAILGGFGLDTDAGDVDFDVDVGDADLDVDVGDADLDIDGDAGVSGHPSPLSIPIVLVFMTSFGALGMLFEVFKINMYLVPVISALIGIVIAAGTFFIMVKVFSATQASSVIPLHKLVGLKAKVSVPILDGNEGQVVVVPPGAGRMLIGAISNKNVARDSVVEILEVVGDVVRVRKVKRSKKKQAVMK
ncbi:hypothetical protein [[Eubacterium] cellulosolvens]